MTLSWAIIGRFLFFPLKFSRKPVVRDVLLLLLNEADSGLKGCSDSTRLLFEISEHPLVFQNFWIAFTKFLLKRFEPDWFKCKPLPPWCLTFVLLLFIALIFTGFPLAYWNNIRFHIYHCSSGKITYFNTPIFLVYSFFIYAINDRITNLDVFILKAIRSYCYQ